MGSKVVLNDINSAFPDLFFFVFAPKIDRFLVVSCDVLKQCEESVTIIDGDVQGLRRICIVKYLSYWYILNIADISTARVPLRGAMRYAAISPPRVRYRDSPTCTICLAAMHTPEGLSL